MSWDSFVGYAEKFQTLIAGLLAITEISKPKQTETVQRWKLAIGNERSKIEFSRRGDVATARYEPISGQPGAPGSMYRLVPKNGDMVFVATVIANDLPNESRFRLDADKVTVAITARYLAVSSERSRLVSEEVFTFKGFTGKVGGFLARVAIHRAHRRQMEAFKRFAEG